MKMPSIFWIFVIGIGAAVVAVGNICYLRAKQAEDKKIAALTVWNTLGGELQSNSDLCKEMKRLLSSTPQQIPMVPFETGAWETVSSGNLIVSLDGDTQQKLIKAYSLINRAKNYQESILDRSIGIASALSSSGEAKTKFLEMLRDVLNQLGPILDSLVLKK